MRAQGHDSATGAGPVQPNQACAHPDCALEGLYRAPRSRQRLNDYHWFCLDHVRAYNRAWDFCAGMGEADIENAIRAAACWERPTWRLGQWYSHRALSGAADVFGLFGYDDAAHANGAARPPAETPAESRALKVLGLAPPIAWAAVRARYKLLAKRLHPDANGGDKSTEERLKLVNQAYSTLKILARS